MKRKQVIPWDSEMMQIELLDWKHNPHDFDRLCDFVIKEVNESLKKETSKSVDQIIPIAKLRDGIRRTAEQFDGKHKSLSLFVVMWIREVVKRELKRRKADGC